MITLLNKLNVNLLVSTGFGIVRPLAGTAAIGPSKLVASWLPSFG